MIFHLGISVSSATLGVYSLSFRPTLAPLAIPKLNIEIKKYLAAAAGTRTHNLVASCMYLVCNSMVSNSIAPDQNPANFYVGLQPSARKWVVRRVESKDTKVVSSSLTRDAFFMEKITTLPSNS